jgi:hypothetical protein
MLGLAPVACWLRGNGPAHSWTANRYSVPAHWAGTSLTARICADRLELYHQEQRVAEHVRSYERHRDFEHPDHVHPLLAQRQKAREQQLLTRFLINLRECLQRHVPCDGEADDRSRVILSIFGMAQARGN